MSKNDNTPRLTMPLVPAGHPDFKWSSGADVQKTWRKYGWTPPSEGKPPPPVYEERKLEWLNGFVAVRRVK
jgi:hypothetical protein